MDEKIDKENSSILYLLGQLTAKVDTLLSNQTLSNERHDELEGRVSVLEKDKAKILGGAVAVSAIVGFTLDFFLK